MAAPIGIGLGVASGIGQVFTGSSARRAAAKAARQAEIIGNANARDLEESAADVAERADQAKRQMYWNAARVAGRLEVAGAASRRASTGSLVAVQAEFDHVLSEDLIAIDENANREMEGLFRQADLARLGGATAAAQHRDQGLAALISGVSGGVAQISGALSSAFTPSAGSGVTNNYYAAPPAAGGA